MCVAHTHLIHVFSPYQLGNVTEVLQQLKILEYSTGRYTCGTMYVDIHMEATHSVENGFYTEDRVYVLVVKCIL